MPVPQRVPISISSLPQEVLDRPTGDETMIADEYDAAQVLLAAYSWPGDMNDDEAVIDAATTLAAD